MALCIIPSREIKSGYVCYQITFTNHEMKYQSVIQYMYTCIVCVVYVFMYVYGGSEDQVNAAAEAFLNAMDSHQNFQMSFPCGACGKLIFFFQLVDGILNIKQLNKLGILSKRKVD